VDAWKHLVQAGFQLPGWSRRGFLRPQQLRRHVLFSPTPIRPDGYAFTQQHGNGDLAFLEADRHYFRTTAGAARLSILRLRYDWQNYFHDDNNLAPRFWLAFAPGNKKTNVFRAGAGLFNDRSGTVAIAEVLHSLPGGLVRYVITDPGYPDPFSGENAVASPPPSIVRLAPDVQIPQTFQYSLGVDHQLQKSTTLSVTYTGARGYHLFRSRDVNAPQPPLYAARPNPAYGAVRQIESTGRQESDSLQVTMRGRVTRWFNGQMQYTLSRVVNDTNGIAWFPANDYDLSGEWARADFDRRHRFLLLGRVSPGACWTWGGAHAEFRRSLHETLGQDIFNNGRGRARPAE
jgi:hypothetical protein